MNFQPFPGIIFTGHLLLNCMKYVYAKASFLQISDAATREGAKLLDHWFIGCHATYVVCEDASVKRYVGHSDNIVTVSNTELLQ